MTDHILRPVIALLAAAVFLAPSALCALPDGLAVEDYVDGLQFPVSIAATGTGEVLVAEKFGTVRLVRDGQLLDQPLAAVDVTTENEAGLIGITTTPDFADSGQFLILYTPDDPLDKIFVSLLEIEDDRARMLDEQFLELPSRPSTDRHYSGNLRFGPDGALYISLGDLRDDTFSQDESSWPGSILRFNADGTIPDDNPFGSDNPVYAYGLRNSFDFGFDADGRLYASENGAEVNDEVNLIEAGNNYGWPLLEGYCDNFPIHEPCEDADAFVDPAYEFRTVTGPTGVVVYTGELIEQLRGDVLVAGWHSEWVHRLVPGEDPTTLEQVEPLYVADGDLGITDVKMADDGAVLLVLAGSSGGQIKRIVPDGSQPDDSGEDAQSDGGSGGCTTTPAGPGSGLGWLFLMGATVLAIRS